MNFVKQLLYRPERKTENKGGVSGKSYRQKVYKYCFTHAKIMIFIFTIKIIELIFLANLQESDTYFPSTIEYQTNFFFLCRNPT